MLMDHPFAPRADAERYPNCCVKCARTPDVHPASPHMERDPGFEGDLMALATEHHGLAPAGESLLRFAQSRAHDGPVRDYEERDYRREALEEFADAANYVCWRAQRHADDHEIRQECAIALTDLVRVWARVAAWRDEA